MKLIDETKLCQTLLLMLNLQMNSAFMLEINKRYLEEWIFLDMFYFQFLGTMEMSIFSASKFLFPFIL